MHYECFKKVLVAIIRVVTIYALLSTIAIFNYSHEWIDIPYHNIPDFFFILANYYNPLIILVCGLLMLRLKPSQWERIFGWVLVTISPFWFVLLLHMMSGEY